MENDELAREESSSNQTKLPRDTVGTIGLTLIFAIIELDFIHKLIHSIAVHAQLYYVWSACAFQVGIVVSWFSYWRCSQMLLTARASTKEIENIASRLSSTVACLLLSMMMLSTITAAFTKAK